MLKSIKHFLFKLSGEDFAIIQQCNKKIQLYFSIIGLLVFFILICSFASALYFTEHLFHSFVADIGVGIIWGYIVTNMYVLLLYTISPTLLPIKIRKKQKEKTYPFQLSFSLGLRIFIVILLAVIIAQPLNVFILKPYSDKLANDIKGLLATNPLATFITFAVIAIFLLPVYLKYSIRKLGEFYEKKAKIKKQLIENNYKEFKRTYKEILENKISEYNQNTLEHLLPLLNKLEKINPDSYCKHFKEITEELSMGKIEKYEYWADPPYRTILKNSKMITLSEKELLTKLYSSK